MRPIDADALIEDIEEAQKSQIFNSYYERMQYDDQVDYAIGWVEYAPTIDAVPVVHNKEIDSSVISVKNVDEWHGRIILDEGDESKRCRVYYQDVPNERHGRWIHCAGKSNLWYCSECGDKTIYNPTRRTYNIVKLPMSEKNKFCRNCGARMDGDPDDDSGQ